MICNAVIGHILLQTYVTAQYLLEVFCLLRQGLTMCPLAGLELTV